MFRLHDQGCFGPASWIQGIQYNFYGHSNSQLKSRTCFLFAGSKEAIRAKVDALGDFTTMKTVQKKAKRIGLLFSVADVAMVVDPRRCEDNTGRRECGLHLH